MSEVPEFVYSILRADGGWFKVGEETAKNVTIAYLAHNPAFLRSILTAEQVEALRWALNLAPLYHHNEHGEAIRAILGGDERAE